MAAAAGNSGLLEDLELSFSLRKEQRTAQKSFLIKEDVFGVLPTGYGKSLIYQLAPLVGKLMVLLWLVVALSYCVQREFERQPFIPPLGLSSVNGEFPDPTSGCGSGLSGEHQPARRLLPQCAFVTVSGSTEGRGELASVFFDNT